MARKGESKIMKVFKSPTTMKVVRRKPTYVTRIRPGPHPKARSVPLSVILKDILKFANNAREVRVILNEGRVSIDGRKVKDPRRPVGFMDVLSFSTIAKHYRMLYDEKGRLIPQESEKPTFKLCRIQNKTKTKQGLQLNLHDGKNILVKKDEYKIGGTVKISLPEFKILEYYPMEKGSVAYVIGGKHAGEVATIQDILPGTKSREPLVMLKSEKEEFQTPKEYVFVVGTKTPVIKLKGETK